jgi:Na+-translocating ferredoxin:NAD+ oxidoreductase RnfC subunit
MAALPPDELQARAKAGALYAKYAQAVDPQSAHEIISARLAAGAAQAAVSAGVPAGPTPAQIRAQANEAEKATERANREAATQARAQAKEAAAEERAQERAKLQREREITQVGTTVLRGVMGTFFGGGRRRR